MRYGREAGEGSNAAKMYCSVMAGLVPAIYAFLHKVSKTWMPGTSPGMTSGWF